MRKTKKQVQKEISKFISNRQSSVGRPLTSRVSGTDIGSHLEGISDELAKKVIPTAVQAAGTIVRKEAVRILKRVSDDSPSSSKKTGTRGRNPLIRYSSGNYGLTPVTKRGPRWFQGGRMSISSRGGASGPSLGDPKTIIKKKPERKGNGLHTSQKVGPRYVKGGGPLAKNFAHTHEPKIGSTGAPNHKWWGKKAKKKLKARPYMGPAGKRTQNKQIDAIKESIKKWKIKRPELE